jgi:hypothetical protein
MGLIYAGIPEPLVLWLKGQVPIATFVETGTYFGNTTLWAASNFNRVISIEADERLYEKASVRLRSFKNIELHRGQSQEILKRLIPGIEKPTIVWLDAHWSGLGTAGEDFECPLLEEILAVDASAPQHYLLIDDGRLFLNPPQPPHKPEQWPAIGTVIDRLRAKFCDAYIGFWNDVIVRVPKEMGPPLEAFMETWRRC